MNRAAPAPPRSFALTALTALIGMAAVAVPPAGAGETPSAPDAEVYIVSPENGARVRNPVRVVFGLRGMGVAPAGVDLPDTGHHHLLIDVPLPRGEDLDNPLPADENHIHFGGGQTETEVTLAPGEHTLQLLLGDQNHIPHNPPVYSEKITITVTE